MMVMIIIFVITCDTQQSKSMAKFCGCCYACSILIIIVTTFPYWHLIKTMWILYSRMWQIDYDSVGFLLY
jgi:hypothetical protein